MIFQSLNLQISLMSGIEATGGVHMHTHGRVEGGGGLSTNGTLFRFHASFSTS